MEESKELQKAREKLTKIKLFIENEESRNKELINKITTSYGSKEKLVEVVSVLEAQYKKALNEVAAAETALDAAVKGYKSTD